MPLTLDNGDYRCEASMAVRVPSQRANATWPCESTSTQCHQLRQATVVMLLELHDHGQRAHVPPRRRHVFFDMHLQASSICMAGSKHLCGLKRPLDRVANQLSDFNAAAINPAPGQHTGGQFRNELFDHTSSY